MSDSVFSVRPAAESDLDSLWDLERQVQVHPWTREHLAEELSKPFSETWVLTDDETDSEIAGYLVFWSLDQESHLLNLGVSLKYRGLGYGRALVRHLLQYSQRKGHRRVTLEVRKSNSAAVALYQAFHFTVTHIRKGFYPDGEDAYFMEVVLTDDAVRF